MALCVFILSFCVFRAVSVLPRHQLYWYDMYRICFIFVIRTTLPDAVLSRSLSGDVLLVLQLAFSFVVLDCDCRVPASYLSNCLFFLTSLHCDLAEHSSCVVAGHLPVVNV